ETITNSYQKVRPAFSETLSPELPLGLNLGRQLYWLAETFPSEFASATDILLLPQYWAWRFSGVLATECSSLGCHTDLWNIAAQDYSSLVDVKGWRSLFPPLKKAWDALGPVRTNLQTHLGLPANCMVFTGIHDSNASLLRYLQTTVENFALVSTGTWTIAMAIGAPLEVLDKDRDMLANCDARGRAVACSRFMGGREYANICAQLNSPLRAPNSFDELQEVIDKNYFSLPNFSEGSGPFPKAIGKSIGGTQENAAALATLYCALMMDLQLELLEVESDIFIEGSFLKNPFMLAVLAQLRAPQTLYISESQFGTVQGCALLSQWNTGVQIKNSMRIGEASALKGLDEYKKRWRNFTNDLIA
ncbi:MAG: FGGY family carbohydrate kinase, partial [Cellvibrio sp.]